MRFEYYIGLRYLRARRKQAMISVITAISIFGVALGVAALIIVIAVMTGFESDLRDKILGTNAHIVIMPFDYKDNMADYLELTDKISRIKGIKTVSPFVFSKVMISNGSRNDGIILKGIDPEKRSMDMGKYMRKGSVSALRSNSADNSYPGIIMGIELAAAIGAKYNGIVRLVSSGDIVTPMGVIPKTLAMKIVGYFQTGMYEYDRTMAYTSLDTARRLTGLHNGVSGFEIWVNDIYTTQPIVKHLKRTLGNRFWIRDWKEMNRTFFAALKLEKLAMFVILTLIVFVAAFNIISSLTMMVMEKHKDIGILKAMGASARSVHLIFMAQGIIIGIVGTGLGCVVGVTVSWIADTYKLIHLQGEVYYISHLPFQTRFLDVLAICAASLAISFLATIYPARQAAKLNPVEAIRYE